MPRTGVKPWPNGKNITSVEKGTIDREQSRIVSHEGVWCPINWDNPKERNVFLTTQYPSKYKHVYQFRMMGLFRNSAIHMTHGFFAGARMIADDGANFDRFCFDAAALKRADLVKEIALQLRGVEKLPQIVHTALSDGVSRRLVELPNGWNKYLDRYMIKHGIPTRACLYGMYHAAVEFHSEYRFVRKAIAAGKKEASRRQEREQHHGKVELPKSL